MKKATFIIKSDAPLINEKKPTSRVVEVEFTAPEAAAQQESAPLNLGLVIDRSGSMSHGKLEQVKVAVAQILDLLRPADSVAIVDYDDRVTVTAESGAVTPAARDEIKQMVSRLTPRGMTDLCGGWLLGCERVAEHLSEGRVNRVLLLTDGLANRGITNMEELSRHASALFERRIVTSTFGVGEDFNEHLLEAMANKGGGNYYYIDTRQRIPELLMEEFKDLAAVALKNVTLELTFPAGVAFELFGDWRAEKSDDRVIIDLGDLAAKRNLNLFLKLLTPPGSGEVVVNAQVKGMDAADKPFELSGELRLRYAPAAEVADAEEKRDKDLVSRYSTVVVGHISNQAFKLERIGKFEEAGNLMDRLMLEHGVNLPESTRMRYERIRLEVREGLDEPRRKNYQSDSYYLKRHRHEEQKRDPGKQT